MPVPDHQHLSREVVPINAAILTRPSPVPEVIRSSDAGSLDIDQLAAVLARLLDL